jgi:thioredoxin reductase (NADPH)
MPMETDIIIIGSGASGVQAAIHAARKKVGVVVIGRPEGSALMKAHIENYFGFGKVSGTDILQTSIESAKNFGVVFLNEEVIGLEKEDKIFLARTDAMKEVRGKAVILAMGITRNKLNVEGEKEFHGLGVSYCANCDAGFFKKKPVVVVGDGSAAAVSALLLKDYASKVYWVMERNKASPELMEKVKAIPIEVVEGARPKRIIGEKTVKAVELTDGRVLETEGVFIEMGAKGAAELAMDLGILPDDSGNIPVDKEFRTEAEGVFACGDITGLPWQLAKAVGEGCVAGLSSASYVRREKE